MTIKQFAGAGALTLLVAACGQQQKAGFENQAADAGASVPAANQIYSGSGTVQSVSGDRIAIAHGPISGIGWPAMTMTFTAPPGMANGIQAGRKVDFSFRRQGGAYVLTSVKGK